MGNVQDDAATPRAAKRPAKGGSAKAKGKKGGIRPDSFLATLLSNQPYKPRQGRQARLWTFIGFGTLALIGIWRVYETLEGVDLTIRAAIAGLAIAGFGWVLYRLVHYPAFADFLIATQAEMNKVSWITKDDLKRATTVVLTTVLLLTVFLFAIDQVWMTLLNWIGVLQVAGAG